MLSSMVEDLRAEQQPLGAGPGGPGNDAAAQDSQAASHTLADVSGQARRFWVTPGAAQMGRRCASCCHSHTGRLEGCLPCPDSTA